MLHDAAPPFDGDDNDDSAAALGAPPLPAGAFGGRGLAGAAFDCVLPTLLMAVGGAPAKAEEIARERHTCFCHELGVGSLVHLVCI